MIFFFPFMFLIICVLDVCAVNCGVFGVDLSFKQGLEPVSNGERRRWSMRVPSNKRADWVRMWIVLCFI